MRERRRLKRYAAQYPVTVYDSATNQPFGQLIDLSAEGMRIISEEPTDMSASYHLNLELPTVSNAPGWPEDIEVTEQVNLRASSVWCDQLLNTRTYDSGLQLEQLDDATTYAIRAAFQDALFRR